MQLYTVGVCMCDRGISRAARTTAEVTVGRDESLEEVLGVCVCVAAFYCVCCVLTWFLLDCSFSIPISFLFLSLPLFPPQTNTHTHRARPYNSAISAPRGLHCLCVCVQTEEKKENLSVSYFVVSGLDMSIQSLPICIWSLADFLYFLSLFYISCIPSVLWCISRIQTVPTVCLRGISDRIYKMSGDQNLGDKLRLRASAEICCWRSWDVVEFCRSLRQSCKQRQTNRSGWSQKMIVNVVLIMRNHEKTGLGEFRLCSRIKVVIPNIAIQAPPFMVAHFNELLQLFPTFLTTELRGGLRLFHSSVRNISRNPGQNFNISWYFIHHLNNVIGYSYVYVI